MEDQTNGKKSAAQNAVEQIQDGMVVGLGSGSTTRIAIEMLGLRVRNGLKIKSVSSSQASAKLARELGIQVDDFTDQSISIYIDGADEVDPGFNLIKGGGGALLREKFLALRSDHTIIIVDETKMVPVLGRFPLPLEINQFGSVIVKQWIEKRYDIQASIRPQDNQDFITDNGNFVLDCQFGQITHPEELSRELNQIPGVVETGLFVDLVDQLMVGYRDKVEIKVLNPIRWPKDS